MDVLWEQMSVILREKHKSGTGLCAELAFAEMLFTEVSKDGMKVQGF
jgi:hypothetical protein